MLKVFLRHRKSNSLAGQISSENRITHTRLAAGLEQKQARSRAKTGIYEGIHTHTQIGGWGHFQAPEGAVSDTRRERYKN